MTDQSDQSRLDFMRLEYGNLPTLIAHWDAHFWHKSQWFFAVESVMLAAVGIAFKDTFLAGNAPKTPAFLFLLGTCIFNFWICYVWFRTNRSNREFLGPLLERAREIEAAFLLNSMGTFSEQQRSLVSSKKERHSSHRWENHLPSGFGVAWAAALLTVAVYVNCPYCDCLYVAMGTLALTLIALLLFECLHPKRDPIGSAPLKQPSN